MNASTGRRQTTKGMWLSRCVRPSLLIMDVEGSDGRERGEDDTSFEKQSALFALTVSDLMMVNMWLRDIGREQGGSMPLLRTVFRERAKLEPGRTKVLVIIRGYDNETPFNTLVNDVVTNMEELWKSVHDHPGRPRVLFRDYIEVSVVALPDKIQDQKFKREVAKLREWFATNSLVGFRQDKVSASGFSFSAKGIWESIRQNKRLNLPAHRVMVSSFFCEKVVKESINSLESNEDYLSLKKGARSSPKEFSEKLGSLLKSLLTHFDTETELYEAKERAAKRQELEDEVLHHVESICRDLLYELRLRASSESKEKITNLFGATDDPSAIVDQSVEDCLKKYIESCEDLSTRYKNLCDENCKVLKSELLSFAKIMAERIKDLRIRVEAEHARDEAEQKAQRAKEEAALAKEEAERESQRAKEETERLIEQARNEAERAKQEAADRARQEAELAARNRELNNPLMGLAALAGAIGRAVLLGPAGMVGMASILDPTMQNPYAPATSRGLQPPYPTTSYGYEPPYPAMRPGYGPPYPAADHGYNPPAQSYPATSRGGEPAYPGMRGGYEPAKPTPAPRNPANLPGRQPAKPVPPPRNPANLPGLQPAKPTPPPRNPANLPGSQPAKPTPPPRKLPK